MRAADLPLVPAPIGFAHRGGSADAQENTLEAFRLALRTGVTGLETDAWVTADGVAVLDHDGVVDVDGERRAVGDMRREELPPRIPTAAGLAELLGPTVHLSVDVKDPAAAAPLLDALAGGDASRLRRVWLCHPDEEALRPWRALRPEVRLVHSTRVHRLDGTVEQHAARLLEDRVEVVNMPQQDWSSDLVARCRSAGVRAWAWDVQEPTELDRVLALGVDAVFSDHSARLVAALARRAAATS